jgi:hypothetical protein
MKDFRERWGGPLRAPPDSGCDSHTFSLLDAAARGIRVERKNVTEAKFGQMSKTQASALYLVKIASNESEAPRGTRADGTQPLSLTPTPSKDLVRRMREDVLRYKCG